MHQEFKKPLIIKTVKTLNFTHYRWWNLSGLFQCLDRYTEASPARAAAVAAVLRAAWRAFWRGWVRRRDWGQAWEGKMLKRGGRKGNVKEEEGEMLRRRKERSKISPTVIYGFQFGKREEEKREEKEGFEV